MLDFKELESYPAEYILDWAIREYGDTFAIATSFQKEGMILLDMASRLSPRFRVFTLDTGRLPQETYDILDEVRHRYSVAVEVEAPDPAELAELISAHGANLFYKSVELRALCCEVRKVRPLERKLAGLKAWATGLRRSQGESRASIPKVQLLDGRIKLNPLADWTREQVEEYTRAHRVPIHPLYGRGYASIGCAPCTRPVQPGESERAGRWWWEENQQKECGIHFSAEGKVSRA